MEEEDAVPVFENGEERVIREYWEYWNSKESGRKRQDGIYELVQEKNYVFKKGQQ